MLLEKDAIPQVSVGFMNEVHDEDRKIINDIYDLVIKYEQNPSHNNKVNIDVLFQKWFNHTVKHFTSEEKKMREFNYPKYKTHKQEHTKTLADMHLVFSEWQDNKDITILKEYFVHELPKWIVDHINSMDLETAKFLSKHQK